MASKRVTFALDGRPSAFEVAQATTRLVSLDQQLSEGGLRMARNGKSDTKNLTIEQIAERILLIRCKKVMLDADLAEFYGVETRRLNEQVKRNIRRFPLDFCFQLTREEYAILRSQFAISKGRVIGDRPRLF